MQVEHKKHSRTPHYGQPQMRTPRCCGQFSLSLGNARPHIFSKFTRLIRTLSMAPSISVLTEIDYTVLDRKDGRFRAPFPQNQG